MTDKGFRSVKGMSDAVPPESQSWRQLEESLIAVLSSYGYQQIRLPIIEHTEVFERSIGDVTDIVQKEMYTFEDRNGDRLTLRPEGTAGCVRSVLQNGLLQGQSHRLWYLGPMFRHERPQKGRYRQFHQVGVECFGMPGPDIDAELVLMTRRMWAELGLDGLRLELNTLGTAACRHDYREQLRAHFEAHADLLDDDARQRLVRNPLRLLDTKNPELKPVVASAPVLLDYLDPESAEHFDALRRLLDRAGMDYVVNPHLVRGLDYYGRTVFEWITEDLGAQGTVCAGGRYDALIEQVGGRATPAIGFAMGLERLLELLITRDCLQPGPESDVYLIAAGSELAGETLLLAETLRDQCPGLRVTCHCGGGSMKSQMRRADRSGATVAVIIGETEQANGTATVKSLRAGGGQEQVPRTDCGRAVRRLLAGSGS